MKKPHQSFPAVLWTSDRGGIPHVGKGPVAISIQICEPPKASTARFDDQGDRLLSIQDAAAMLSIGRTLLYELLNRGEVQGVKLEGMTRIKLRSLRDLIARLPAYAPAVQKETPSEETPVLGAVRENHDDSGHSLEAKNGEALDDH